MLIWESLSGQNEPPSRILRPESLSEFSYDFGVYIFIDVTLGLEHATIRENIIFDSKSGCNETRYQAVLNACALNPDLEALDDGDLTGMIFVKKEH